MRIQNAPFEAANNAFESIGKNAVVVQLSPKSQFDKMIEKIQEQIQKVQENEHYDDGTKKSKIEELEKQMEELKKAKTEQDAESLLAQAKKAEDKSAGNTAEVKANSDGDTFELSIDSQALIQADISLKNMKNSHSMKVRSEAEGRVLASEIKIDKGRGIDTARKEEQLARIKETTEKSFDSIGKAIKDAGEAAQNIAENSEESGGDSRKPI